MFIFIKNKTWQPIEVVKQQTVSQKREILFYKKK